MIIGIPGEESKTTALDNNKRKGEKIIQKLFKKGQIELTTNHSDI